MASDRRTLSWLTSLQLPELRHGSYLMVPQGRAQVSERACSLNTGLQQAVHLLKQIEMSPNLNQGGSLRTCTDLGIGSSTCNRSAGRHLSLHIVLPVFLFSFASHPARVLQLDISLAELRQKGRGKPRAVASASFTHRRQKLPHMPREETNFTF